MSTLFPLPALVDPDRVSDAEDAPGRRRQPTPDELLEGLNPAQRQAIVHEGPALLVVAGAG